MEHQNRSARVLLLVGMVVGAALLRLAPHPPNFVPLGALALFSGAQFGRKSWAFATPLLAMLLSDSVIHLLRGYGFHSLTFVVYGCMAAIVCIGMLIARRVGVISVAVGAVTASVLFYVVTNFAVWATSGMYPLTAAGLAACYVAAVPFFWNSLAADLFYAALLFGGLALLTRSFPIFSPQFRTPEFAARDLQ